MFTMTDMIEVVKTYKFTRKVKGNAVAEKYFQETKAIILRRYGLSEDMFRGLWNGANSITSQYCK